MLSTEGGFGRNYLAEDTQKLNETCVIKQFAPKQSGSYALKKAVELFNAEAKLLQDLGEHPQIPALFAYFEDNGFLYLVQQFIKGENLFNELTQKGTYNETQIQELLLDLLPILKFIHERDVIHRDIKPQNIMRRESDGKLVLIDFGASKELTSTVHTQIGTTIGSYGYSPYEQIKEGKAYPASDLFALGVTCFHLFTGNSPFELWAKNGFAWVEDWRKYSSNSVSKELGTVLDKLLKFDVNERYQSADEVIKDLEVPETLSTRRNFIKNTGLAIGSITTLGFIASKLIVNPAKTFNFEVVTTDASGNIINKSNSSARYFTEDLGNGVTLEMVEIPGGKFMMGSPENEAETWTWEKPQHQVTVPGVFMGKYEVTQKQYQAIMGSNPSDFRGENHPVENVSWDDAVAFCEKLSQKTGKKYTLPSEAQWEYACRAGTTTPFYFGESITPDLVNYDGNYPYGSATKGLYRKQTTDVGTFPPNAFGLYDMHGNLWEWCLDDWQDNYVNAPIDGSNLINPTAKYKVVRGGFWFNSAEYCRSAARAGDRQSASDYGIGFRVVLISKT
ncbi:bifunctional serine/threonine-protein kinase/formylglycine-generating enzyme family protein [Sphaerospermopsis kisseleviana CS-549]|uniref:Bifunctional serine/threonine-protein kinase/formylglycine-generating enzyme family protein n=1 Tax=Sphaerospermopsis kisseleviana CS-549 TaxID=3021783 RepID=A0ABT4ZWJ0_9CYAN|nr:bifunctional serine/threonine-protein kinase/formylglycine-generating enzyme family protein [Sphaerospermopsis kisseleviana]MDB9443793.1 bifunctional serine/threonine-protein kinase/formylglycine-generating enzyme family protein [Sphaerospermopsis kisseleviana CS-549]